MHNRPHARGAVCRTAAMLALIPLGALSAAAGAAEPAYPSKPLRFIVPYHPGGTPDIQGRLVAERLRERLGQPVVVDNRAGANGGIGLGIAARAPADGHTLAIAPVGPWAVNPHLYRLGYDTLADFAPVILVATIPAVLVVHPSLPVKSVEDLVAHARQHPGSLHYGSTGVGGFGHLCGELFTLMTKTKMVHVPYKSVVAALADVAGGHIQVSFNVTTSTLPHIRSGRLRGLATTGTARVDALAELPTVAEAGVPGYENSTWNLIAVPARTPGAVVARLNREIDAILATPEVREMARNDGYTLLGGPPARAGAHLRAEHGKFARLIREAGIRADPGG